MKELADTRTYDLELSHVLQRNILRAFLFTNTRTYSELLPDGMAGNSFLYHLRALIRSKLIVKNGEQYVLTPLGKLTIESMSIDETRFKLRPVSGVFIKFVDSENNVLCFTSLRQPLVGYTGLVFAKLRLGESYEASVERVCKRRFVEKVTAAIRQTQPVNVSYYNGEGELVAHRMGALVEVRLQRRQAEVVTSDYGHYAWVSHGEEDDIEELHIDEHDAVISVG